jgi:formylglycine-generating enzyme required for sulfatase activity
MFKSVIFIFANFCFQFISCECIGQTISNVHSEQIGNTIQVHYNLNTTAPCKIDLFVSIDGGKNWQGPLLKVQGSVGKNVAAGENTITWIVGEEWGELVSNSVMFKVSARGKKQFEPEMVFVEGGSFMMGSSDSGYPDEKPIHQVELESFFIGKYEVTQAQWKSIMKNKSHILNECDNCPIENISWDQALEYIERLNTKTDKKYRLPTEAEWEYAARGGINNKNHIYSGSDNLENVGAYIENVLKTQPCGTKQPNELGIFDMSGNVWEYCSDWFSEYSLTQQRNQSGFGKAIYRVRRGGGCNSVASRCRVASRDGVKPNEKITNCGFRLVLSVD